MIEKTQKTDNITIDDYYQICETLYNNTCEESMHEYYKEDFYAGFMAAFEYFSHYKIDYNNTVHNLNDILGDLL